VELPDRAVSLEREDETVSGVTAPFAFLSLLACASLIAASPWMRAYGSSGAVLAITAASLVPPAIAGVSARVLRAALRFSSALSAGGLLATVLVAGGFHPAVIGLAIVHGPGRLLTETLPLAGSVACVPTVVVVWMASTIAGELAVRGGPRSNLSAVSLGIPVASFATALGLSNRAPGSEWFAAPALLIALSGAAMARHAWGGPHRSVAVDGSITGATGHPYRALGMAVLLAGVLGAVVPILPGVKGAPKSVYEAPPFSSQLIVDPMAALASLRDASDPRRPRTLLRLTTQSRSDGYLTVAVLDRFDGSEWTFDTTFEPTGGRVPQASGYSPPPADSTLVRSSTTLLAPLPVPLLPVLGRPLDVEGVVAAADSNTGMIVPDQMLRIPAHFQARSTSPLLTLDDVPPAEGIDDSAGPPSGGAVVGDQGSTDLEVPPDDASALATATRFLAAITGVRPSPTVEFLQRSIDAIRQDEKRLDPTLGGSDGAQGRLGGTSLSEVINAVTVVRSATPEQFATFFALVARYLGVPARVVTGFRVGPGSAGLLPPGSYTVTDRQAWTWVEVPVSGMGWIVADPTPGTTTAASTPAPEQVQAPPSTLTASKANAVPRTQPQGGHAVAKPLRFNRHSPTSLPPWLAWLLPGTALALVVTLAGPGLAGLRRTVRRRRRFSRDPVLLAGGAWLELLDGLARAGMQVVPGATSSEVATEAGHHFGAGVPDRVMGVGQVADRAMCSVLDPPDVRAATEAWNAQRVLEHDIYRSLERWQRIRLTVAAWRIAARRER
jgi:hypothetical protein